MKRNSFLKLLLSAGALIAAPFSIEAREKNRTAKGFKIAAGKDRFDKPISLFEGDTFFTKVSTKDTDGDVYMFESTRVKKGGPPLHYHPYQDEWWYILEGEFLFKVGEESFTATKGDSVFGPRNVPHAFAKTNDGDGRLLMLFQPAGQMEEHFKARSEGLYDKMSEEEQNKIRKEHGFIIIGPALTYLKM